METWDIVENYYYWDFHPRTTYLKNKLGLYKYLFKKTMASISEYYRDIFIDPLQEKCNELVKENFYLKKKLEYYKLKYKKNNVRNESEDDEMDNEYPECRRSSEKSGERSSETQKTSK